MKVLSLIHSKIKEKQFKSTSWLVVCVCVRACVRARMRVPLNMD